MIELQVSPTLTNEQMNQLFSSAWPNHKPRDFRPLLERSLEYIATFDQAKLVGFVNIAWDGGVHGFILDTTVHVEYQRQGIGLMLLDEAKRIAEQHKLEWLHVDFLPEYESFYRKAGYESILAGLLEI